MALPRFTEHLLPGLPGLFDSFWFMVCLTAVSACRPPVGCFVRRANLVPWRFINPLLIVVPKTRDQCLTLPRFFRDKNGVKSLHVFDTPCAQLWPEPSTFIQGTVKLFFKHPFKFTFALPIMKISFRSSNVTSTQPSNVIY